MSRISSRLAVSARGLCIFLTASRRVLSLGAACAIVVFAAAGASAAPRCGSVHAGPFLGATELARFVEASLGREIPGRTTHDSGLPVVARVDGAGRSLGQMAYSVRRRQDGGLELLVEYVGVNAAARGTGVSTLLLATLIARTPGIERIVTEDLIEVNRAAYDQARARGLGHREALRETPAYRSYRQLGFTEILSSHRNGPELSMTVGLDPAYRGEGESHRTDFDY